MIRKTVLIDNDIVQQLNLLAKKEDRDFSSSIRYALRIGLIAIQNPELTAEEIEDILEAKAEFETGMVRELSLENL
jgi:predicted transcriptional regulator